MKVIGYLFYGIAIILCLSIFARLGKFIGAIISLFGIFSPELTGMQRGQIIGGAVFWIVLILIIYILFKYGNKFTSKK